ncbi:MAG: hypothetical protein HZC13_03515 [Nitrospirae bacterium]|nr:hypothetical protein [Nitrospirota bacterium]
MKKVLLTITLIGFLATGAFALEHSQMHEMMMEQGGPKTDTRTELKMPEPMKVMHKGIMWWGVYWGQHIQFCKPPRVWLDTYENARYQVINKDNYLEFIT